MQGRVKTQDKFMKNKVARMYKSFGLGRLVSILLGLHALVHLDNNYKVLRMVLEWGQSTRKKLGAIGLKIGISLSRII